MCFIDFSDKLKNVFRIYVRCMTSDGFVSQSKRALTKANYVTEHRFLKVLKLLLVFNMFMFKFKYSFSYL